MKTQQKQNAEKKKERLLYILRKNQNRVFPGFDARFRELNVQKLSLDFLSLKSAYIEAWNRKFPERVVAEVAPNSPFGLFFRLIKTPYFLKLYRLFIILNLN